MTKVDSRILLEIDQRTRELMRLEKFTSNPVLRKQITDRCYAKACKEYGVQPRRKHG